MLDLGFETRHLYMAVRLEVTFGLRDGKSVQGFGTGFVVRLLSDEPFAVTARHVIDPRRAIPKHVGATFLAARVTGWNHATDVTAQRYFDFTTREEFFLPEDDEIDIALIPLTNPQEWNGVNATAMALIDLAVESEFDVDVRTGDFIAAPGYTVMPGVENERPVLLTGIVSSDPRVPVTATPSKFRSKAVLYQSLSRAGLSGAPVFATQRGLELGEGLSGPPHRPMRLIGVNAGSFIDKASMPLQFSYFTRSSEIHSLLAALGKS